MFTLKGLFFLNFQAFAMRDMEMVTREGYHVKYTWFLTRLFR